MKIVWHRVRRAGSEVTVAFIDTENIDLDIDTISVTPDRLSNSLNEAEMLIDDGRAFDDDDEEAPPSYYDTSNDGIFDLNRLYFGVETFKKLRTSKEIWDQLLLAANIFFASLPEDDLKKLCLFYIESRRTIDRDLVHGAIIEVTTFIGNRFYDIAVEMNLPAKLLHHVRHDSKIPIPDLSYAGTNIGRDDPALTFYLDDYYVLLAICIVCKILFPIWGDIIERTSADIDNEMKETYCMNVIEPFLSLDGFRAVRDKLYNYVANTVDTARKGSYSTASFTATIGGVSTERFYHIVFSTLIVKRYVTVELYKLDGNITVWTWTCAKQSFSSLQQTLNKRCHIMPRIDITESSDHGGDDERKISILEHGSHVTEVTADIPQLLRFGVRIAIERLCREYKISDLDYQHTVAYYRQNPIVVSAFNKIIVGVFLGNHIGGAQSLKYLDVALFTELVAITQLYIATEYAVPDVVNLLTAMTIDDEKPVPALSNINTRITTSSKQTNDWHLCESAFPYAIDGISIGSVLKRLQDHVVKYHHFANTAPVVSATMDRDPPIKGSILMYEAEVVQDCCRVIYGVTRPRSLLGGPNNQM